MCVVVTCWCTLGRLHDYATILKLGVMTSDKHQVGRFSQTVMKYNRYRKNDHPGMDAHSF